VPDALFSLPRLAAIYDVVDGDRSDLDTYVSMAEEFAAGSVLDIGCGTGSLACLLAARGLEVTGVDPAEASIEVARRKPGAEQVRFFVGEASVVLPLEVDLVTMTGNAAQVFLDDESWIEVLAVARAALRPRGHLVFETRDPAVRAWEAWTKEETARVLEVPKVGRVSVFTELTDVSLPFVSFESVFAFEKDRSVVVSRSTLRFRDREEIETDLNRSGLRVVRVQGAPDRPNRELVFVAEHEHRAATGVG
jgi:SAM-dependent methyltransferase